MTATQLIANNPTKESVWLTTQYYYHMTIPESCLWEIIAESICIRVKAIVWIQGENLALSYTSRPMRYKYNLISLLLTLRFYFLSNQHSTTEYHRIPHNTTQHYTTPAPSTRARHQDIIEISVQALKNVESKHFRQVLRQPGGELSRTTLAYPPGYISLPGYCRCGCILYALQKGRTTGWRRSMNGLPRWWKLTTALGPLHLALYSGYATLPSHVCNWTERHVESDVD